MNYRIVVRGRLGERSRSAFEGLSVESRNGRTELSGEFTDQSHLLGVLLRLLDLGIELVSVNPDPSEEDR